MVISTLGWIKLLDWRGEGYIIERQCSGAGFRVISQKVRDDFQYGDLVHGAWKTPGEVELEYREAIKAVQDQGFEITDVNHDGPSIIGQGHESNGHESNDSVWQEYLSQKSE